MLVWVTVDETSTTGDSPLTVTVSCSPPTVEFEVETGGAVHLHDHAVAGLGREPGEFERHRVAARRQAGQRVQPLLGAHRGA